MQRGRSIMKKYQSFVTALPGYFTTNLILLLLSGRDLSFPLWKQGISLWLASIFLSRILILLLKFPFTTHWNGLKSAAIQGSSAQNAIVRMVNLFFNTYVLHEEKYAPLQQTDANKLRRVQYGDCPAQHDGYNGGIFAIAVVFYLAERKPLNIHTFSQNDVTKARSLLAQAFAPTSAFIPRNVFKNCFPMLRGESTIDSSGVEIITPVHSIIRNTCNTRSHPIAFLGDGKSGLSAATLTCPKSRIMHKFRIILQNLSRCCNNQKLYRRRRGCTMKSVLEKNVLLHRRWHHHQQSGPRNQWSLMMRPTIKLTHA